MAGAVVFVLGLAEGSAAASSGATLSWAPTTSAGADDFGTVTVGQTASHTFKLTNSGTKATGVLTVSVTGAAFTMGKDGCSGATLSPGARCRVTVTYAPATGSDTSSGTLAATSAKPAASASLTLTGAGGKESPGIATAPSAIGTGDAAGTAVTDTVALAGGYDPTGQVEFQLFGPSASASCSGTPVFDQIVTVNGDGTYASPSFTPATGGNYWWTATYNGDPNNTTAASNCGDEMVSITPVAQFLYWVNQGIGLNQAGTIMRSNLDGSGLTTLVADAGVFAAGVAVDSNHIYWTGGGDTTDISEAIMEANLDGTGVTTLVPSATAHATGGLAVDGNHIYWADPNDGAIMEANLDGTGVTTLISTNGAAAVAVAGGHIYWTVTAPGIAVAGEIMEANLDGTGVTTLVPAAGTDPEGIAVAGGHIFWASTGNPAGQSGIFVANLDGTDVSTVDNTAGDIGVAADSSHIFWDNTSNGAGSTVTGDTLLGGITTLASGQVFPRFMALGG